MERVSVVRAILNFFAWAIAGVRSKPKGVTKAPAAETFRKSRRPRDMSR